MANNRAFNESHSNTELVTMNVRAEEAGTGSGHGHDNLALAVILPALFAIVLIVLVGIAILMPKLGGEDTAASREERKRKRLARLDQSFKAQDWGVWARSQQKTHPEASSTAVHALCVICLDEFEDAAQIRGLGCLHVFHQECLDDWFGRWNEYCPLCHRPIIQGLKGKSERAMGRRGLRVAVPGAGFLV